ncbi:MAG: hypothetical protein KTR31_20040 [Myxococcales bacterium]|nr:hypothetical protein [Myxococcales bacterium]
MILLAAASAVAHACSFPPLAPLMVDATRTDGLGPSAPDVEVEIVRGTAGHDTPRGWQVSSCNDLGLVELTVRSATEEAAVGLALDWVAGELPVDLLLPEEIVSGPSVLLHWVDGAVDEQEPLDFALRLTPFDEAGDAGEPVVVSIFDPGSTACRTGAGPLPASGAVLLLALALTTRRRA